MLYASSYREKEYYDYLDEIHFSTVSQVMEYYLNNQGEKLSCIEVQKVGSVNFNGEPITLQFYHDLLNKFPQLRIEFYNLDDLYSYSNLYYEDKYSYHYAATDYNMINTLLAIGVSDIIINEPLTFDITNVVHYIRKQSKRDIKIHIRPDIGKPGWMPNTESILHHFWILPQHIDLYENQIDMIDLFAESIKRENRLIECYCIKKDYSNSIGAFVLNSNQQDIELHSKMIDDDLAIKRLNCRQICMSTYPQKCHTCDQQYKIYKLGKKLYQKRNMLQHTN